MLYNRTHTHTHTLTIPHMSAARTESQRTLISFTSNLFVH